MYFVIGWPGKYFLSLLYIPICVGEDFATKSDFFFFFFYPNKQNKNNHELFASRKKEVFEMQKESVGDFRKQI